MPLRSELLYLTLEQSQEATVVTGSIETEKSDCGDRRN